ncbi:MAG: hypothetical protein HZB15_11700 [Actinobacteria bacterium]|nr:hypothetical protein [Actinomycetota bacterium]
MTQVRPVRWLRDHPDAADVVLAAIIAVLGVVFHLTIHDPQYRDPSALGVVLVLAATLPLAWRRRAPGTVLVDLMVVQFVLDANEWFSTGWLNLLVGAYTVGAHRSGRALYWIGGLTTAALIAFVSGGVIVADVEWQAIISASVPSTRPSSARATNSGQALDTTVAPGRRWRMVRG